MLVLDCMTTMAEYEQPGHAYTASSSLSWYCDDDVRHRPVVGCWSDNVDEMTPYNGRSSSFVVHPVPVDFSAARCPAAPDAAAAGGGWSPVDLKPCMTSCGLSAYTGKNADVHVPATIDNNMVCSVAGNRTSFPSLL